MGRMLALLGIAVWISGCVPAPQQASEPLSARGSMAGLYEWHGKNEVQLPEPSVQTYRRFTWKELEPSEGEYQFGSIKQELDRARAGRRKFCFRIMSCWSGAGLCVPGDLPGKMPHGFWFQSSTGARPDTYVPDWNSAIYLERARRLLSELGRRFDKDPALGWVEIGLYGNWGEWHVGGFPYRDHSDAAPATSATKKAIVDAHIEAFPTARLIMMTDDAEALDYALLRSPRIGIRRDSLGHRWFEEGFEAARRPGSLAAERWKTAPFVAEFYAPTPSGMFALASRQAAQYHVTAIGNGNTTEGFARLEAEDRRAFEQLNQIAGAKFVALDGSASLTASGQAVKVRFRFGNQGNAPAYDDWKVVLLLRRNDSTMASIEIPLDLSKCLPGAWQQITCALPVTASLTPGDYEVLLLAKDRSGYLANQPLSPNWDASVRGMILARLRV